MSIDKLPELPKRPKRYPENMLRGVSVYPAFVADEYMDAQDARIATLGRDIVDALPYMYYCLGIADDSKADQERIKAWLERNADKESAK